jgi:hypothetical protein
VVSWGKPLMQITRNRNNVIAFSFTAAKFYVF